MSGSLWPDLGSHCLLTLPARISLSISVFMCATRVLVLTLYFEAPIVMCVMRFHCVCVDIFNIELFIYTAVPILRG